MLYKLLKKEKIKVLARDLDATFLLKSGRLDILRLLYNNFKERSSMPFTTQEELSRRLKISQATISRSIEELSEIGLIKIISYSEIPKTNRHRYSKFVKHFYYVDKEIENLVEREGVSLVELSPE